MHQDGLFVPDSYFEHKSMLLQTAITLMTQKGINLSHLVPKIKDIILKVILMIQQDLSVSYKTNHPKNIFDD